MAIICPAPLALKCLPDGRRALSDFASQSAHVAKQRISAPFGTPAKTVVNHSFAPVHYAGRIFKNPEMAGKSRLKWRQGGNGPDSREKESSRRKI